MEPKVIIGGLLAVLIVLGGIVWAIGGSLTAEPTDRNADLNNINNNTAVPPPSVGTSNNMDNSELIKDPNIAVISTAKGNVTLELYPNAAPKTVANFVAKAKAGYFDGLNFHRVEGWVVQGGDPLSRDPLQQQLWGTGGGDIQTELSSLPFMTGALGVARGPDINVSNDSQFFIVKKDSQFLDNQYTLFGQVTGGMDIVEKIAIGDVIQKITIQ